MHSSSPNRWSVSQNENSSNIYFYLFSILNLEWVGEGQGPQEDFLAHNRINIGNKQIADKTYDGSEMLTQQKQRIVTPGDPRGENNNTEIL